MSALLNNPQKARKYVIDYYGSATPYEQALQEIVEDLESRLKALEVRSTTAPGRTEQSPTIAAEAIKEQG